MQNQIKDKEYAVMAPIVIPTSDKLKSAGFDPKKIFNNEDFSPDNLGNV